MRFIATTSVLELLFVETAGSDVYLFNQYLRLTCGKIHGYFNKFPA